MEQTKKDVSPEIYSKVLELAQYFFRMGKANNLPGTVQNEEVKNLEEFLKKEVQDLRLD